MVKFIVFILRSRGLANEMPWNGASYLGLHCQMNKFTNIQFITKLLKVTFADNLCKQFGPRSGLTECLSWSGSKLFDTLCSWKDFLKKLILKEVSKQQQTHLLSTDNLCKQFGSRSGQTERRSWSGSKPFDTLLVFLKDFFEKESADDNTTDNLCKRNVGPDLDPNCLTLW